MAGILSIVATPIGNLGDLSDRARETLAGVAIVAAEDTRRTGKLLAQAGIDVRTLSYFEGNEVLRTAELLSRLRDGDDVALVTDAGMPGVSDPGERLVRACIEAEIEVRVVPGPSAVLAALVVSGLPMDRFTFEGFLPRSGGKRRARIADLAVERRTMVLFESPRRTAATLVELGAAFGGARPAAMCRELTKLHEEVLRGSLDDLALAISKRGELKGEVVLVVHGAPEGPADPEAALAAAVEEAHGLADDGMKPRDAASQAAAAHGVRPNAVYREMTRHD